jgi:hypothetical protein
MPVIKLNWFAVLINTITRWKNFKLPVGEHIPCYKDRSVVKDVLLNANETIFWASNTTQSRPTDPGKVNHQGVGSGTPMQLGQLETRMVTWGSGYGRYNQWKTHIPLPLLGSRYWITGYPSPQFDKRCIIMGPDGLVHELIQFDQDLGILPAGLPQQALNRGTWDNGVLKDGVAVTASGLPGSAYVWGPKSSEDPHVQAFTVQDYLGGDGTPEFAFMYQEHDNLPRCGDWFYLDKESDSYRLMVDKGGECEARAKALNEHGCRLIDIGASTSFLVQAGTWANNTNIREFTINLNDLRRIF